MGFRPKSPRYLFPETSCGDKAKNMKLKTFVRVQARNVKKLAKSRVKIVLKPITKLKRKATRIALLEVHIALFLLHRLMKRQLKLRPRIRLIMQFVALMAVFYMATYHAVAYIKPKEADIKINGRAIVLSEADSKTDAKSVSELDQVVLPKLTPFEFKKPVEVGILSQGFSAYHRANDIAAPYDSPIHPLGAGTVEFAGTMTDGYGNTVIVDHGNGLRTLYAHMNKIDVGAGNKVGTDSTLGTIGLTGHTTGPHVHFEVYNDGIAIDPASVLPEN